jgi:hypothetical protein
MAQLQLFLYPSDYWLNNGTTQGHRKAASSNTTFTARLTLHSLAKSDNGDQGGSNTSLTSVFEVSSAAIDLCTTFIRLQI